MHFLIKGFFILSCIFQTSCFSLNKLKHSSNVCSITVRKIVCIISSLALVDQYIPQTRASNDIPDVNQVYIDDEDLAIKTYLKLESSGFISKLRNELKVNRPVKRVLKSETIQDDREKVLTLKAYLDEVCKFVALIYV